MIFMETDLERKHLWISPDLSASQRKLGIIERGWDGWMASTTWWIWVWASFRNWWWTGKPGVLQSMGSQTAGHDWVTEMNWTRFLIVFLPRSKCLLIPWLQSPSAVFLEPKKIKSVTVSIVSPSICHEVVGIWSIILFRPPSGWIQAAQAKMIN